MFAIVRNASTSTHLASAIADMKNIHVLEADVTDYPALKVRSHMFLPFYLADDHLLRSRHKSSRRLLEASLIALFIMRLYSASMDDLDEEFITAVRVLWRLLFTDHRH